MDSLFDPNAPGSKEDGVFGLPFTEEASALVYVPVPWEATTSYGGGTSRAPEAILKASVQIDLYDLEVHKPYELGLHMRPPAKTILDLGHQAKLKAQDFRGHVGKAKFESSGDGDVDEQDKQLLIDEVNHLSSLMNLWVKGETEDILKKNKIPVIVGGDHSVSFGAFQAASTYKGDYGVLHFDAHADTRRAYEGFEFSHASIMYNALIRIPEIKALVSVGLRDVCEEEMAFARDQKGRLFMHTNQQMKKHLFEGGTFLSFAKRAIAELPQKVWISFDIDALDPKLCPHTGTPVPGGLDFDEALAIACALVRSGREIIGFDLVEVAPNLKDQGDEWDANVGARVLYKLSAYALASQGLRQLV